MFNHKRTAPAHAFLPVLGALTILSLAHIGCSGYRWGGAKPEHLARINSVCVAVVENSTQIPRAAALATNSIVDALTRDGTYMITNIDRADAHLRAELKKIEYLQVRSTREDALRSEELEMKVHLNWSLVDTDNPTAILARGSTTGTTRFFVDPNLQTARQSALVDAIKRATDSMVARFTEGF